MLRKFGNRIRDILFKIDSYWKIIRNCCVRNISFKIKTFHKGLTKNGSTFDIMAFALAQDRSFGIFPLVANKTMTAAVTLMTAGGGDPKDFNSVRLALFKVFNACWAASSAETLI